MSRLRRAATAGATYLGIAILMIVVAVVSIFLVSFAIDLVAGSLIGPIDLVV